MGKISNAYHIQVRKHEGKRPQGRPRYRWEDNIRIDLWIVEWEGEDWMHVAQDRDLPGSCEHGNEPLGSTKGWEFLD